MSDKKSDLVEFASLWPNKSGKGWGGSVKLTDEAKALLSAGARVLVFENRSDNPKAPAFRVMLAPAQEGQRSAADARRPYQPSPPPDAGPGPGDDDIPF